ncbi:hypothetical protein FHS96_004985 [Sphingomonas zeicaulis]|uniref:hypothetical protein n=1 Tax=Sphingomonas zeicaulis TaxID=1632740 RepID=UPI003D25EB81
MGRASPVQTSFNGGELSPRLWGRNDQAIYGLGVKEMLGFVPVLQGPAVAAPGLRYVEHARGPARLIPFEYNVTQSYVIEATDNIFRFYTNDVRIETVPGSPLEVATPWGMDQVRALDFHQSADVLYLVYGATPPRQLNRIGALNFVLEQMALRGGPLADPNIDETLMVSVSGTTGTITITANDVLFQPGDVGGLFQIEAADFNDTPAWEPGVDGITLSARRTWEGRVYRAAQLSSDNRTGTVPPTHVSGSEWDGSAVGTDINDKGPYGILWEYLYDRFGLVEITGYTNDTTVTATVKRRLADSLITDPSWRWTFGAFSNARGWPEAVTIWNERLILAKGATIYGSVVGDYNDFSARNDFGEVTADMAFTVTLPNPNSVRWMAADRQLLVGTARAEIAIGPAGATGAVGPTNIAAVTQSTYGSATSKPVLADGRVLFVQRAGRKVLEMGYAIETDRYEAPDLTRLAEHLGAKGFVELAWQQEPEKLIWAVLRNGELASLTYSPSQKVMGWARRELGGGMKAVSVCAITDPSGQRDQLWVSVRKGGEYFVLRAEKMWETGDDQKDAFLVDAGLSRDGAPISTISMPHLPGAKVSVLIDGKAHPDVQLDNDGNGTLLYAGSKIVAGFPYPSRIRTLTIEAGGDDGTAQAKIKRIPRVTLRLLETLGLRIGVQAMEAQTITFRLPDDPMNQAVPLFTGDKVLETGGVFERGGEILIERFQPLPATLLAIYPDVVVGPR